MKTELFQDKDGKIYTLENVVNTLKELGAEKAKVLYIHSDIGFGKPLLSRKNFVEKLFEAIKLLNVKTLIFPTYTFSFCNKEVFDVDNSRTQMGMLNEYVRKSVNAYRTVDPILSVCVIGEVPNNYYNLSKFSCGEGSSFEIMAQSDDHMFLFFGAQPTQCFTFMHYVEAIYNVPYRYNKEFKGIVKNKDTLLEETYYLCTLYDTCIPSVDIEFQNNLERKGILNKLSLGEKDVVLIKGKSAFEEIKECLRNDINILLGRPYDTFKLEKNYIYKNVNSVK